MKSDAEIRAEIQAEHDAVVKKAIGQVTKEIAGLRAKWAEEDRQHRNEGRS